MIGWIGLSMEFGPLRMSSGESSDSPLRTGVTLCIATGIAMGLVVNYDEDAQSRFDSGNCGQRGGDRLVGRLRPKGDALYRDEIDVADPYKRKNRAQVAVLKV